MKLFEAILWDMDGTLVDSEPIWAEEEEKLMSEYGVIWTDEDSKACLGGPVSRLDEYMRNLIDDDIERNFLSNELLQRMARRLSSDTKFAPGSLELLTEFRSFEIPMALVTASDSGIMNAVLNSIDDEYFAAKVCSEDVANSKPDPEGYLLAARQLGVDIERTLIIEDSLPGMTAALRSGAYLLGINPHSELEFSRRAIFTTSLEEISAEYLNTEFSAIIHQ
jgi:HAD superfamily hydrolase (TIGR01509 family)